VWPDAAVVVGGWCVWSFACPCVIHYFFLSFYFGSLYGLGFPVFFLWSDPLSLLSSPCDLCSVSEVTVIDMSRVSHPLRRVLVNLKEGCVCVAWQV